MKNSGAGLVTLGVIGGALMGYELTNANDIAGDVSSGVLRVSRRHLDQSCHREDDLRS